MVPCRADLGHVLPEAEPLAGPPPLIPSCQGAHFTWGQKEENSKEEEECPHDLQGPESVSGQLGVHETGRQTPTFIRLSGQHCLDR